MNAESTDVKNILGLQLPSDPRWVNLAEMQLAEILTDHAYCEQKAATTCISLITKYSDRVKLVQELSPIVTEEWGHLGWCWLSSKKGTCNLVNKEKTSM
jgi:tRNA-(ms[2]io[6]A)-hydroxylase